MFRFLEFLRYTQLKSFFCNRGHFIYQRHEWDSISDSFSLPPTYRPDITKKKHTQKKNDACISRLIPFSTASYTVTVKKDVILTKMVTCFFFFFFLLLLWKDSASILDSRNSCKSKIMFKIVWLHIQQFIGM